MSVGLRHMNTFHIENPHHFELSGGYGRIHKLIIDF